MHHFEDNNDTINWRELEGTHRRGKIAGGALLILVGSVLLAHKAGVELPWWLFNWQILLIGIGLVSGIKHRFRRMGWLAMVGIGSAFLLFDYYPLLPIKQYFWPLFFILIGIFMIFRNSSRRKHEAWQRWHLKKKDWHRMNYAHDQSINQEDHIESVTVFGGVKKNIISKNFKGGEVVVVFGGGEFNLMQADFEGTVVLELVQVMGGTRLIIPSDWEVKSSMVTFLGSIEDKRPVQPPTNGPSKTIIIQGTAVMGGIDIKSY